MAVVASAAFSGAAASAAVSPCKLPAELRQAGLLTEAAARYHAIERAAGGRAAPACVRIGFKRIERIRHRRAQQITDAVVVHNREVKPAALGWQLYWRRFARRLRLLLRGDFRWPTVDPTRSDPVDLAHRLTIDATTRRRMVRAARAGRADLIPKVVAHGIARAGGWYGLEIARVLVLAHYPLVAAAVVEATVDAHPVMTLPRTLSRLVDGRREAAAALRAAARHTAARHEIAAAKFYSRAGLNQQSEDAVARAIELYPRVRVDPEIRSPRGNTSWWNSIKGQFGPWLRTIVEMLITALVISVLLLLVARSLRRFRARVVVEPFVAEPRELGVAMIAAVREACAELRGAGGRRLKTVTSSGESFNAIPRDLANVSEQAGSIAALLGMLGRLVPARTRQITGQVRPRDRQRGAGLTVTFGRHGKVFEEQTLWEWDFGRALPLSRTVDTQQAYDCLALPAAVWLTFTSANHTLWRGFRGWIGWPRPFDPLGTDDWRSFAQFAVGAELQENGARDHAEQAYNRALGVDPRNRGAALNLAMIELHRSHVERALRRLDKVDRAIRDDTTDELWFRVRYGIAIGQLDKHQAQRALNEAALLVAAAARSAAEAHRATAEAERASADADQAIADARTAAVELCAEILDQRPWRRWRFPGALNWLLWKLDWLMWGLYRCRVPANIEKADRVFLRSVLPSALLSLASTLQQDPDRPDDDRPDIELETLRKALNDLRKAPADRAALAAALRAFDAVVRHPALVRFVVHGLPPHVRVNAEGLYNRACYEARVAKVDSTGECWEVAARHLYEAMWRGGPGVAAWALEDRALQEFRSDRARHVKLREVEREIRA